MGQQVAEALDAFRNLGTPEEMRALAQEDYGPQPPPRVNAHIHLPPNFSAFESVEEAVNLAAEQGVGVLCAGDVAQKAALVLDRGFQVVVVRPELGQVRGPVPGEAPVGMGMPTRKPVDVGPALGL